MSEKTWMYVGLFAQGLFGLRFLYQWVVSERRGESVIPRSFWYLSLAGSLGLLAYSLHKQDVVFIVGQSFGFIIYTRNLMLLNRRRAA